MTTTAADPGPPETRTRLGHVVAFTLEQRLVTLLCIALLTGYGLYKMPFPRAGTPLADLPSSPIAVDAIPDIGEKQQIVFTRWPGRSPKDVEDQVTFPLVSRLQGVPGTKSVRGTSMFGFSTIAVIFDDGADFYESRSRVLEKLASVGDDLPRGVTPELGPDASALGQVFWYTLEGEGFSLEELRREQDFFVRYALQGVFGVAEVASVGGVVREIQVDVAPEALQVHGVTLFDVERAVMDSNLDVGARELVLNGVEYLVRGKGLVESPRDVEDAVIRVVDGAPLTVREVARVSFGPAPRRGALDKLGAEAVGGVVTARYGENPRAVIARVKARVDEIAASLPEKALDDGRTSRMRIVPFYDRTTLIDETVGTLGDALIQQMLITILVILLLLLEFKSALLVSATLPIGVLFAIGLMGVVDVESNIMSLGGVIIAIGTMVDMGIVLVEAMLVETERLPPGADPRAGITRAVQETGAAVLTAVATTVIGFLPVFAMTGPEAKLFVPLAMTKTFALVASIATAMLLLPTIASFVLRAPGTTETRARHLARAIGFAATGAIAFPFAPLPAVALFALAARAAALAVVVGGHAPARLARAIDPATMVVLAGVALLGLTEAWMPLGLGHGLVANLVFVVVTMGGWLGILTGFLRVYPRLLAAALAHQRAFLVLPSAVVAIGLTVWLSFSSVFGFIPAALDVVGAGNALRASRPWSALAHAFPGLGREFMPPLDEGSFLYMPSVMPHASISEALSVLELQDRAIGAIPEVASVVGKIGRAETALDPAPLSMIETVIAVKPEFIVDEATGAHVRAWRPHVRTMDDIWDEIVRAAAVPGATSAPKLMPIATRIVMLQSGMRAPFGLKVRGRTLDDLEEAAIALEGRLREIPGVVKDSVVGDRVTGTPYVEIALDRDRARRLGVRITDAQAVIETALGGRTVTTAIAGRERTNVRVRYAREARDSLEALSRALVPVDTGVMADPMATDPMKRGVARAQVPLAQLADVEITPGPRMVKSEDGFLVAYVTFDKARDLDEVTLAERVSASLTRDVASGALRLPTGTSYTLAGTFENQVRSARTLALVLPVALALILVILLLQLRRLSTALLVFSSIAVAWAGGFLFLWIWSTLAGSELTILGVDVIGVFRPADVKLSVAVWVGFIALFGIASDDGVIMATFIKQRMDEDRPTTVDGVRAAVMTAAQRRIRPCLMTTATTVLALLPVLTSTGRGADVMTPMALPSVGGMLFELLTLFVVPVLYAFLAERRVTRSPP